MMRKASLLVSAALMLMLPGCAEEETNGIATARSQMKPLVDAACDWMFGCCSPGELTYQVGDFTVDADDCGDRLLDAVSSGQPLALEQGGLSNDPAEGLLVLALSINEGRVDVNSAAVRECAEATRTRDCNVLMGAANPLGRCTPTALDTEADPCEPNAMFDGKQGVGEECDGPWECQDGLRCIDFGIAGVCALRGERGDNCFDDGECGDGLVCAFEDGTCQPGSLAGEGCQYADPLNPIPGTEVVRCADGLTCDPATQVCTGGFCAPGSPCADIFDDTDCPETYFCAGNSQVVPTCQLPGLAGAPCTKGDDCASTFCDQAQEICADLLATGEACLGNNECASGFCFNSLCTPSFGNDMPCASGFNEECQAGYCDQATMTCTAYSGPGGPCPTGFECDQNLDLQCVDGTCLALPFPNGTTCVDSFQCASQACFMGICAAGAVIGAPCRADGSTEPCVVGSFCEEASPGSIDGICAELRRPGELCTNSSQCWGECVVRFGKQMCDSTPAFLLDEVWCDGP